MTKLGILVMSAAIVAAAGTSRAATSEEKCHAGRYRAKVTYESCVNKWLGKVTGGTGSDSDAMQVKLSRCRERYAKTWLKLSALSAGVCTGSRFVNGTLHQHPDGSFTIQSGPQITDRLTGLEWERKSNDGTIDDFDNTYSWGTGDLGTYEEDGTAFTTFLRSGLNTSGFGGANGWRMPTLAELLTLVDQPYPCATSPCVDPAFNTGCVEGCTVSTCSCTNDYHYWTATTVADELDLAWRIDFRDGNVYDPADKSDDKFVRAVRGGL